MADANVSARVGGLHVRARHLGVYSQKTIVFAIFVMLFALLSVFVPTFLTVPNLLALLQSVSILGISGLGMAVVVIGRGIDISMIAALAVPAGILLQLVQWGHSVPYAGVFSLAVAIVFGLLNGWLIAYAEVPSLFTTLASGLSRRLRPNFLFPCRCRAMESGLALAVLDGARQSSRDTQARHHVRGGGGIDGEFPATYQIGRLHLFSRR